MQQGLIDIRNKAKEMSRKSRLGMAEPYIISCGTLIAILDDLESAQQSVQRTPERCSGTTGHDFKNGVCLDCGFPEHLRDASNASHWEKRSK